MFIIYDKSLPNKSPFKRVLMMSKNGELYFWNNFDKPCGTTSNLNDPIWRYIDSLPHKAQIALSEISEELKESKSNKDMKKTINEAQLKQIVAESVKRVLKESIDFQHGYKGTYGYGSYISPLPYNVEPNTYVGEDVFALCQRIEYLCKKEGYENPEITAKENRVEESEYDERFVTIEIYLYGKEHCNYYSDYYTYEDETYKDFYNASKQASNLAAKIQKILALNTDIECHDVSITCRNAHITVSYNSAYLYDKDLQVRDNRRRCDDSCISNAKDRRIYNTIPKELRNRMKKH